MAKDVEIAARHLKCPPLEVFKRAFGSFRDALRAAKLPFNEMQEFSERQLISQLQNLSEALARPLTKRDVTKAAARKTCARVATFVRVFGSMSDAFLRAGVQRHNRYSKNELITQYRALSRQIGRPARISDIQHAAAEGQGAGFHIYKRLWGALTDVRKAGGTASRRKPEVHAAAVDRSVEEPGPEAG
jgi:hypothetical protein